MLRELKSGPCLEAAVPLLRFGKRVFMMTTNDYVGNVALVPEPSTCAMMIFGFCSHGFMAYSRRYQLSP